METKKIPDNSPSSTLETDILYRCRKCKNVIVTGTNLHNLKLAEKEVHDHSNLNKSKILFFVKEAHKEYISDFLNYKLEGNSNVICKKCEFVIGYYKYSDDKNKIHGILKVDSILLETIKFKKSDCKKRKIEFVNKLTIENLINIKKVKNTNEILKSFTSDFFKLEMLECKKILTKTFNKIDEIYSIVDKNEI